MKKTLTPNGRKHGLRARLTGEARENRTVLTLQRGSSAYYWTTDRRNRLVVKH